MADWTKHPSPEQQRALDAIQEQYRAGHKGMAGETDPMVPHPSLFQRDPLVIGGGTDRARLAQEAKRLLDLDPTTKARAGSMTFGPTAGSMDLMHDQQFDMGTAGGTNLLGVTDHRTNNIGIQRHYDSADSIEGTMAHEIAHVAGHGEKGAYATGDLARPLTPPPPPSAANSLRDALLKLGFKAKVAVEP